ncbi:MAG: general stress protein [Humibacter sp.]
MSSQGPLGGRQRQIFPTIPRGEVVAAFESYPEAQSAVEMLVKGDFPAAQISIVGSDLKTVERVTGRLTWGRVAAAGAASGVWLGIFFGLLIVIFSPTTGLGILIAAVLLGAGFGMLFGVVSYAITRRTRDYTSMTQVLATSYSVIVDPESANRARNLLTGIGGVQDVAPGFAQPGHPSDPPPPPVAPPPASPPHDDHGERPRYGENPPQYGEPQPRYGENPPRYGENPPRYGENPPPPAAPDGDGQGNDGKG